MQYTNLTPNKIADSLIYRTLVYVNICGSYKLSSNSPVFWPTLYIKTCQYSFTIMREANMVQKLPLKVASQSWRTTRECVFLVTLV